MKPQPRRRRRRGWMSAMKNSSSGSSTNWFVNWVVIPLAIGVLGLCIVAYIYIQYFDPGLVRGERTIRAAVLERVEQNLADGRLDTNRSHLVVEVEGRKIKLRPLLPYWNAAKVGDVLDLDVGRSTSDGTPVVYSYKPAPAGSLPTQPAPPGGAPTVPPASSAPPGAPTAPATPPASSGTTGTPAAPAPAGPR